MNALHEPRPVPGHALWRDIHARRFASVKDCWQTCGGGFCCTGNHPDMRFFMIRAGQVYLPMLQAEYDFLQHEGRLQPGAERYRHVLKTPVADGRDAKLVLGRCAQGGLCFHPETRPLICKIYPFVPAVDDQGGITGFHPGNIFDYLFHHLGRRSPCTVLEEQPQAMQTDLRAQLADLCREPYFMFYFQAYGILVTQMKAALQQHFPNGPGLEPLPFFRQWENLYLTNRFFEREKIREALSALYLRLRVVHGDFEI